MTDVLDDWEEDDIVVVPGLPGRLSLPEGDRPTYPGLTLAFVKINRAAGLSIRLATEDKREVSHHAADVWLPILNVGLQVLVGGAGSILAEMLIRVFDSLPRRKTIAHIEWYVQAPDGSVHEFRYDGDSETAVEAARAFERSLGYGDGKGKGKGKDAK